MSQTKEAVSALAKENIHGPTVMSILGSGRKAIGLEEA